MLKLFVVNLLAENGLGCDCCVETSKVEVDVYAKDETHALEIIRQCDPFAIIKIQSLEEKGSTEGVRNPGIIIVNIRLIYKGYYGDSPFRAITGDIK